MRMTILGAATLAVATLALAQIPAAHADGIGVSDPKDLGHGVDLRSVEVEHRTGNVVVTTTHTDLRPSFRTGSSGSVFLDTDPDDRGPEYLFVALPPDAADLVDEVKADVVYWGVVPVRAWIGETSFTTAMFPREDTWFLPLKVAVRRAEDVDLGDVLDVRLQVGRD